MQDTGHVEDRRSSARVPIDLPATWRRNRVAIEARVTDISEAGLYLCTTERTDPGCLLELEVTLTCGRRIPVLASACFVGPREGTQGIGLFVFIPDLEHERTWVEHYYEHLTCATAKGRA